MMKIKSSYCKMSNSKTNFGIVHCTIIVRLTRCVLQ